MKAILRSYLKNTMHGSFLALFNFINSVVSNISYVRITDAGDRRITDAGDVRITEGV